MHRTPHGVRGRLSLVVLSLLASATLLSGSTCSGNRDSTVSIGAVQGRSHTSPRVGEPVTVRGVVTAVRGGTFVVQDDGDGDDATSDALVVRADVDVVPGTQVEVTGVVTEDLPGGRDTNLTTTMLVDATVDVRGTGAELPAPVVLGRGGRALPTRVVDDDGLTRYEPATDGIDFYESLESMLVRVNGALVISETSPRFGELWVLADGGLDATSRNARGGVTLTADDENPERIQIDDDLFDGRMPELEIGDRLEDLVGIVGYAYGNYEVLPLEPVGFALLERRPVVTTFAPDDDALRVATFNVLNLGGDEDDAAFDARARVIVTSLESPALIALQEMQDDDGASGRGNPSAAGTFGELVDAIERVGGPRYAFTQIDPVDGADGGEPGGNIRVGYLYDPRRIELVRRGEGGSTDATAVEVVDGTPRLTLSPGRVGPGDPDFERTRKPLAAEFRWNDTTIFVVNVHLSSKGGSTPLYGSVQPPVNGSEDKRAAQADVVRTLVDAIVDADADARVIVLGDFNEFDWNPALRHLTDGGALRNLTLELPEAERATYVYQGNAQALDHVLVTGFDDAEIQPVHVNSGRVNAASDHDPVLVQLR